MRSTSSTSSASRTSSTFAAHTAGRTSAPFIGLHDTDGNTKSSPEGTKARRQILITKDTRDETYHYASRGKEQRMAKEIDALKRYFAHVNSSESATEWKGAYAGTATRHERLA